MKVTSDRRVRDFAVPALIVVAFLSVLGSVYVNALQILLPIAALALTLLIYLVSKDRNVRWISGVLAFAFGTSTLSNFFWYLVPDYVGPALGLESLTSWYYYYYTTSLFWLIGNAAIAYALLRMMYSRQWYLERRIDLMITVGSLIGIFLILAYVIRYLNWQSEFLIDIFVLLAFLCLDIVIVSTAFKIYLSLRGELRHLAVAIITFFGINFVADLLFETRWLFSLSKLITINLARVELSFHLRDLIDITYNFSLVLMTCILFLFVLDPFARRTLDEVRGRLKDTQLFVDDLIAKSPDATCIFDRDGRLVLVNDAFLQIFGLKRTDIDRSFNIFGHIGARVFQDTAYAEILKARDSGTVIIPKLKMRPIAGGRQDTFYLYIKMFPTYGADGRVSNYVMIIEDITARIEMETALRQSEEKFRVLAETSPAAICLFRGEQFLYVNPAVERISGYSREEFAKMTLWDLLTPEFAGLLKRRMGERNSGAIVPSTYELSFVSKGGEVKWVNISIGPVEINNAPAFMVSAFDSTERMAAEQALRGSEDKYRNIVEQSSDGILISDERGIIVEFNAAQARITGRDPGDWIGRYIWDYIIEITAQSSEFGGKEPLYALIRAAGENGYRDFLNKEMDVSIRRPDGEIRSINMISFLTETHRGKMFGTMVRDVTERKRAEEALRESEEKFRAIFEQAAVGIAYVGLDGQFVGVNNKYCDITGYSRDEMLRLKYPDITYADDHGLDEMIRNDLIGRISTRRTVEKRYVRKDGSLVWVSLTVSLVKDADGQPKYFIAVAENIAERKRLEGDLLRAYDSLKEEYERRIDFTNAAAHELRTPLTPIIGYTDILKSEVKDERHLRFLEIIERNALRQKTLVNRMLELASLDAGMAHVRNTEFPLRPLVAEIADNYRAVNPNIRVEVPAEMRAETDPDILRHVLDNLVSNAVKYSDSEKEIEIRVSEAGDSYQFSVKDHGAGIPREEWVKIFERFYIVGGDTDSRTSGRSGLGLALVRAYIRLIGGHVWLESEPGTGSTFFFTVPRKPCR